MAPAGKVLHDDVPPFLRWAGGKRWLLQHTHEILGSFEVRNYHEPFLGGASMFLGLNPSGKVHLSDLNADLIETYRQVRDHPIAISNKLASHRNSSRHYYKVRNEVVEDLSAVERAARFIYLNHTSFNGIYRVNLAGQYNVPYGDRDSPQIPTRSHLTAVSKRLTQASLTIGDFASSIRRVREGDLVFLDPPYTIAHNHNGFIKYNQTLFSFDDQRRLAAMIDSIRLKGAYYVLTNAAHESIAKLFGKCHRRLEVSRRNVIGGKNAERGSASEYVFTNVPSDD